MSDEEILGSYAGRNTIRIEEMQILNSESSWFTDEILNVALTRVISNGSSRCGIFVRSDVVADVIVFRQFIRAIANENSFVESEDNIDPITSVDSAYEQSKNIWTYQNIFTLNSWFHTILNFPENSHWIFVGINARRKIIFIVDSMWTLSKSQIILDTVKLYIQLEHTSCTQTHDPIIGDFDDWSIYNTGQSPQQQELNNCGVHAVLVYSFKPVKMNMKIRYQSSLSGLRLKNISENIVKDLFFDETIEPALSRLKNKCYFLRQSQILEVERDGSRTAAPLTSTFSCYGMATKRLGCETDLELSAADIATIRMGCETDLELQLL